MANVRQQLSVKGAGPDVQEYVEQLLLERHQSYSGHMTAEADKRRVLLDHVSKLEVLGSCFHCDKTRMQKSALQQLLVNVWHSWCGNQTLNRK